MVGDGHGIPGRDLATFHRPQVDAAQDLGKLYLGRALPQVFQCVT